MVGRDEGSGRAVLERWKEKELEQNPDPQDILL